MSVILIKIAQSLYHVTRFLQNRNTNFDETWHAFQTCPKEGLCEVSAHITNKQKIFTNKPKKKAAGGCHHMRVFKRKQKKIFS